MAEHAKVGWDGRGGGFFRSGGRSGRSSSIACRGEDMARERQVSPLDATSFTLRETTESDRETSVVVLSRLVCLSLSVCLLAFFCPTVRVL